MAFIKCLLILLSVVFTHAIYAVQPDVLLAKVYDESKHGNIEDYLVSEKFDGVRAIWTGDKLITRKGNAINAPAWFTTPLPPIWLDGELWIARNKFALVSGIVRTKIPNNHDWQSVVYQVFDMPDPTLPFSARYKSYTDLVAGLNTAHIKAVKQHRFENTQLLTHYFKDITKQGAEGVMLHLASAVHKSGRNNTLLKLKPYLDAEALVIEHLPGKGKYTGMLGALKVKTASGQTFKIGTGFSDAQRQTPPAIGSTITYRYHGLTKNGLPRFASFLRVREPL
ncbi:DNA ligase (ATP) [Pseudoalteromonas espejiana DSM 9414]|uniref:ATP-dependent DNA ligase n=1 Tax=Pseudoalteromonas espejiana TaxID=28107 RepID=A0A510XVP4_9GAMM|nr:DNA ligase [Pseudoalteromonas espejiana]ASM49289.1 DNA ligase (ATP) [Pseudoalteromonas espejiana DSM 9414]GEK55068.1 ATP-dependent DNA ligase [Pseudoalteromonas espejiana]